MTQWRFPYVTVCLVSVAGGSSERKAAALKLPKEKKIMKVCTGSQYMFLSSKWDVWKAASALICQGNSFLLYRIFIAYLCPIFRAHCNVFRLGHSHAFIDIPANPYATLSSRAALKMSRLGSLAPFLPATLFRRDSHSCSSSAPVQPRMGPAASDFLPTAIDTLAQSLST